MSPNSVCNHTRDKQMGPNWTPVSPITLTYLEQTVLSHAAHARSCSEDFCGWCPKFPKLFVLLAHNSIRLCLLEFCLSIFVVWSCSNLSKVRQCGTLRHRLGLCKLLHYANELLVRIRLPFQKLLHTRQTSRNNKKLPKTDIVYD